MINLTNKLVTNVKFYTASNHPNEPVTIYAKQFDINSRYIRATMCDGTGQKIIFPSNTQYQLNFRRPDGMLLSSNAEIHDGKIIAGFGSSMLAISGHATCELSATYGRYASCESTHDNAILVVGDNPEDGEISIELVGDGFEVGSYVYLTETIVITSNNLNVIVEASNTSDIFENIIDGGIPETVINYDNYNVLNNKPIINADLDVLAPQSAILHKVYCHSGDSSATYQRGMFYYSNGSSWNYISGSGSGGGDSQNIATLTINGEEYDGSIDKTITVGNVRSSTYSQDNSIVRFHDTTGKQIQTSNTSIDDNGIIYCGGAVLSGDLLISGNITQNGETYQTHAEEVYTSNDYIVLRDGATSGLATNEYAGLEAVKYDGSNNGRLVFDNSGTAKVGDIGAERPLTTRSDSGNFADGHLVEWDSSTVGLVDSGKSTGDFALHAHEHTKSEIIDFPSAIKNPQILKVQKNGTDVASYDGSTVTIANLIVPTKTSDITNDSDFTTKAYVDPALAHYIDGTGDRAGTWIGTSDKITSYQTGTIIMYKIPVDGASTTTLNINGLGAKRCYRNNNSALTTHFGVGYVVAMVYDETLNSNSGGWRCIADYDSNELISHIGNESNPHGVTKAQVGLENVDNTSDSNKPISTLQQAALDMKFDKSGGTVSGNITCNGDIYFNDYYSKRWLGNGSIIDINSINTSYNNLGNEYKGDDIESVADDDWHRMWRIKFPSNSNFIGRIKVLVRGYYPIVNEPGTLEKEICCGFENNNLLYNKESYSRLSGGGIDDDFRITSLVWNETDNVWEIIIYSQRLYSDGTPGIMIETWCDSADSQETFNSITFQESCELTQVKSYDRYGLYTSWQGTPFYTVPTLQNEDGDTLVTDAWVDEHYAEIDHSHPIQNVPNRKLDMMLDSAEWSQISSEWETHTNTLPDTTYYTLAYGLAGNPQVGTYVATPTTEGSSLSPAQYSYDGNNWSNATGVPDGYWMLLQYGGGTFVSIDVAAQNGSAMYSTDGITWIPTTISDVLASGASYQWIDITYGNGKFVAIGQMVNQSVTTKICAVSTDGINWTTYEMSDAETWSAITCGNEYFLILGGDSCLKVDKYFVNTADSWTNSSNISNMPRNANWSGLTYGNGRFVVLCPSDDYGQAWSYSLLESSLNNITADSWSMGLLPYDSNSIMFWSDISFGNSQFMLVGYRMSGSSSYTSAYSIDGLAWIPAEMDLGNYGGFSVTYGDNKFIATSIINEVGEHVEVAHSIPGETYVQTITTNYDRIKVNSSVLVKLSSDNVIIDALKSDDSLTFLSYGLPENDIPISVEVFDTITEGMFTVVNSACGSSSEHTHNDATTTTSGFMSASDKTNLNTLVAMLDDTEATVDSIQEVLNVFQSYPEGTSVVNALAGKLDKTGGTITGELLFSSSSEQSLRKGIKWSPINSKNPYIGYALDQTDGTFILGSLLGTNYSTGLSIGGGSGNLLWKGTRVATATDISGCAPLSHTHTPSQVGLSNVSIVPKTKQVTTTASNFYGGVSPYTVTVLDNAIGANTFVKIYPANATTATALANLLSRCPTVFVGGFSFQLTSNEVTALNLTYTIEEVTA